MANDELVDDVVPCGLLVDREVAVIMLQPSGLGLGREGQVLSQRPHTGTGVCELGEPGASSAR